MELESLKISKAFTDHFGATFKDVPAADWFPYTDFLMGRYGWVYPFYAEDGLVFPACPQMIAKHVSHFDMMVTDLYIEAICWMVDRYTEMAYTGGVIDQESIDQFEIHRQIEHELYDFREKTMEIMSKVQLKALDNG